MADATRLQYEEKGSGRPVVFLHPTPLDHDYWRPMIAELRDVRAIVPDLRGHGASALGADLPVGGFARVPDAPVLTMQRLAQDVLALLDHLDVTEAVFAGCSIGGYVLLELWRLAPQRMKGLAFVCSKPQADGEAALTKRAENIARIRGEGVEAFFDTTVLNILGKTAQREYPTKLVEVRSRMTLSAEAAIAVQAGLATRPDSMETVSTITVPLLSIAGGEDSAVSPAEMEAFRNAPGGCSDFVLPTAGHLAAYEQPAKVAELLTTWLRRMETA